MVAGRYLWRYRRRRDRACPQEDRMSVAAFASAPSPCRSWSPADALYAVYDARAPRAAAAPLIGMVRRTEIRIAPELSGRLGEILVEPGARRRRRARSWPNWRRPTWSPASARPRRRPLARPPTAPIIYAGVRPEEQEIADKAIEVAAANLAFAEEERDRASALAAKGFASRRAARPGQRELRLRQARPWR